MAKTDSAVSDQIPGPLGGPDMGAGMGEELFQELVAGSLQGVLVYGDDGPLFCSDLCARIFGYGSGERFLAEGPRDFHDLIVPEQRDAFRDLAEELLAEHWRADQQFDLRALRRDGTEIWVVLKRRPVTWRGASAILVTVYDITRLKTSELRFHEFEGRFQRLVDSTQAIVVHVASNGQIRMVNRAAEEFMGLPRGKLVGQPWHAVVDPERAAGLIPAVDRVLRGETVEVADVIMDSSGRARSLSAQVVPETGLSGAVHGFFYVALDTTEREAAAQALREGEERYRSLVEGSLQAIALLQDGEPVFVNETFARIFGYDSPSDYLSQGVRHIADHFLDADREDIAGILSLPAAGQDLPAREGRVFDAHGREIWLEYLIRPCVIGDAVLSQFTALDITERKHSVSALHESELLLRNLIDQSPSYIACLDREGRYIFANAPLADLLGFPVAQIRGKAALLPGNAEGRFPIDAEATRAALEGKSERLQSEIAARGQIQIIESNYFPRWSGTEIVGVFMVAFDVTERERAARALRESEERFRKLIEIIPYGIIRIDRDGAIRLSNPAHDRLLGYETGELEGRLVWDLFVPEEQEMQRESFRAIARARPSPFPNLGRYRHANGKVLDVLFNWNYEYNADGKVDGFISVITDVTEELNAKRELHFAKEQAERANLEKSRFLAATSHDLQQPLHSLSILLGLLSGQKDEDKRQSIIATMGRAVEGARVLLRAVLDLSKLEAGVVVPRPEAIPVDDLMEQVLAELGPQAETKGLSLRVVRSSVEIWSDRLLIKGIFHNLVSNAIRYTRKGKILIGGRRRGDHFILQVWDTGKGIPKDKQREIFREFTRLDQAQDDKEQSYALGLGLSIVERMCDLLGHHISVQSEVGKGSVFSVEVPLARISSGARKTAPRNRATPPASFKSGLILLIEDNATTALATRQLIEEWGHRCLVAMTQADALTVAQSQNQVPDLILADYNLDGGANGIDVAKQIMAAVGRQIPTILVTANDSPACLDEARKCEMPVLSKPANPARLRSLIAFSLARVDSPDPADG